MTSEETLRLVVDLGSAAKDTGDLEKGVKALNVALTSVAGEGLSDLVKKSTEAAAAIRDEAVAVETAGKETKIGLADVAEAGAGMFAAFREGNVGRAVKDVTDFASLLPGLSAFAPALKLVGAAAETAWPLVKEWAEYFLEANKSIDAATTKLAAYTAALKSANVALVENDALLAARAADEKSRATPEGREQERAQAFADLTRGRHEDVIQETANAVRAARIEDRAPEFEDVERQYQEQLAIMRETLDFEARGGTNIGESTEGRRLRAISARNQALAGLHAGEQAEAEQLLAEARLGKADALDRLARILPEGATKQAAGFASAQSQKAWRDQEDQAAARREQQKEEAAVRAEAVARLNNQAEAEAHLRDADQADQVQGEREMAQRRKAADLALDKQRRESEQEERRRPLEQATRRLEDFNARRGSPLNAEDVERAAAAGVKMGSAVHNLDAALKYQFDQLVRQREHDAALLNGLANSVRERNNRFMGADQTGNYSGTPNFVQ